MKRSILAAWVLIAAVFGLGLLGLAGRNGMPAEREKIEVPAPGAADSAVTIRAKIDGTVQEMDLDTYLQGVLRAEMPASFALEALKAQAVAARTETLYKVENGPVANHPRRGHLQRYPLLPGVQNGGSGPGGLGGGRVVLRR